MSKSALVNAALLTLVGVLLVSTLMLFTGSSDALSTIISSYGELTEGLDK